jgi:hypothetical protein
VRPCMLRIDQRLSPTFENMGHPSTFENVGHPPLHNCRGSDPLPRFLRHVPDEFWQCSESGASEARKKRVFPREEWVFPGGRTPRVRARAAGGGRGGSSCTVRSRCPPDSRSGTRTQPIASPRPSQRSPAKFYGCTGGAPPARRLRALCPPELNAESCYPMAESEIPKRGHSGRAKSSRSRLTGPKTAIPAQNTEHPFGAENPFFAPKNPLRLTNLSRLRPASGAAPLPRHPGACPGPDVHRAHFAASSLRRFVALQQHLYGSGRSPAVLLTRRSHTNARRCFRSGS